MKRLVSDASLRHLRSHLKKGGLIAYPTESCYGLGCLPQHNQALRRLIKLKKRSQDKGMIVIANQIKPLLSLLAPLSEQTQNALKQEWPACKTFLLPAKKNIVPLLRGKNRNNLAVRVPDLALARQLCEKVNSPLVSTSCNQTGKKACKNQREVRRLFGRDVLIIKGQIGTAKTPSQIIDWSSGKRVR